MIDEKIKFDYAQIGNVKLHYATAGDGEKLVILLHGFPEFWYSWRHQLVALSDEYTVVAPDMRGYNLSDKPLKVEDYRIDKLVDDICGLIQHFGRKKAAVIGHDWGASIAWAIATKHPEYLWKLGALQVPPISVWKKNQTFKQFLASWYMFFFQIPRLPEFLLQRNDYAALKDALKKTTAEKNVFTDEDLTDYKKAWNEPFALTAMLNYYRANIVQRLFAKTENLPKIKVPTLFIYGEKDSAVLPETVKGIGEIIDAPYQEIRIPDAAHWVQQEAAEIVTDSLREFLAE
ncbi:epoxide hydrolase EphM [soil metagenome]|jgi:pimeloyl-ACP methyl ester carboxylesterase|nr:alpha/beta hydrolase [Acidobacteriota bacterium]